MSVVRKDARRRWATVASAVTVVCLLPFIFAAFPQEGTGSDPARLRDLVLASARRPFQGSIEVHGELGLPDLPNVGDLPSLLSGTTKLRAWYASPAAWRVAELTATGETDTYRTADSTYVWDFESNLLTRSIGDALRLPRAADLLPPTLARRLLQNGAGADELTAIPGRRVAGVAVAGLRWAPTDSDTTIARIDVWADPVTGLALRVDVTGRGGATAALSAGFQDLEQRPPPAELLVPSRPASAGYTETRAENVISAINVLAALPLPKTLAGRTRRSERPDVPDVVGLGAYGDGLSMFAVAAVPGRTATQTLQKLREGGGVPVVVGNGEAYEFHTSLLNALMVRTPGPGRRRTYLLAGSISAQVLRQAGAELLSPQQVRP